MILAIAIAGTGVQ